MVFVWCNALTEQEDVLFVAKGCGMMLDYGLRVIYEEQRKYPLDGFYDLFLSSCVFPIALSILSVFFLFLNV